MSQETGFLPLSLENHLHSLVDLAPGETFLLCLVSLRALEVLGGD